MQDNRIQNYLKEVLENMPTDWVNLTTHRLDIYDESKAKTQFLNQFEGLYKNSNAETEALKKLPTAYDYIRLGHPLSSVLEWGIAKLHTIESENVISFSSKTVPILAILRKNLLENKNTQITYIGELPSQFNAEFVRSVYGYNFELKQITDVAEISKFNGSTIFISKQDEIGAIELSSNIDFYINLYGNLGSILVVNGNQNESYIS